MFIKLRKLLALYFAIIYSWQLSSSGKSLVEKKTSYIYFKGFTDLDFFYADISFSIFSYARRMLYSEHPTFLLARRHLNSVILTNFENLSFVKFHFKHFPRNFLVLTDPLIICIYLRPTNRRFRDQENVHYSTSNLICSEY